MSLGTAAVTVVKHRLTGSEILAGGHADASGREGEQTETKGKDEAHFETPDVALSGGPLALGNSGPPLFKSEYATGQVRAQHERT